MEKARSIRFVVAVSYEEILRNQPLGVINAIEYLEQFWIDGLSSIADSVQPILTKTFQFKDDHNFDLMLVRDLLYD